MWFSRSCVEICDFGIPGAFSVLLFSLFFFFSQLRFQRQQLYICVRVRVCVYTWINLCVKLFWSIIGLFWSITGLFWSIIVYTWINLCVGLFWSIIGLFWCIIELYIIRLFWRIVGLFWHIIWLFWHVIGPFWRFMGFSMIRLVCYFTI